VRAFLTAALFLCLISACGGEAARVAREPSQSPGRTVQPPLQGKDCELLPGAPPSHNLAIGRIDRPFCIVWRDRWRDEAGFRIVLQYEQPQGPPEVFEYTLPADTTEILFPPADSPANINPDQCLTRKDFAVTVFAMLPGRGEVQVDSRSVVLECGS
jgi:hypothetical protein